VGMGTRGHGVGVLSLGRDAMTSHPLETAGETGMLAGVYARSIIPGFRFPIGLKTTTFQVSGLGCRYGRRFRFGSQTRDQYLYLNTRT